MSKITEIKANGLKVKSIDVKLTGADIIVGANGAGKTAITQALEFAFRGAIGSLSSNADILEKYGRGDITASVIGDEFSVTRELCQSVKKGGDVKLEHNLKAMSNGQFETSVKAAQEVIDSNLNVNAAIFDFSTFTEMNGTDRRKYIMDLVGATDMTAADLAEFILSTKPDEVVLEILTTELNQIRSLRASDIIDAALKVSDIEFKRYNKLKKDYAAGARTINDIKVGMDANVSRSGELEASAESLRVDISDVEKDIYKMQEHDRLEQSKQSKVDAINSKIESFKTTDYDAPVEKLKSELKNKMKTARFTVANQEADFEGVIDLLMSEYSDAESERQMLQAVRSTLVDNLNKVQNSIASLTSEAQKLAGSNCPLTGNPCGVDFTERIAEIELELELLKADQSSITEEGKLVRANLDENEKLMVSINSKISIETIKLREYRDELGRASEFNRNLDNAINQLKLDISAAENTRDTNGARIQALEDEKAAIELFAVFGQDKIMIKETLKQNIKDQLAAVTKELDETRNKIQMLKAERQTMEDAKKYSDLFDVWNHIKTQLGPKGIQAHIIKQNLGPVQAEIERVINILGMPIVGFYFSFENSQGKAMFNFGIDREDCRVDFDSLSKGEQLLVTIAMVTALQDAMKNDIKLLVIDEINNLYGEFGNKLISGLSSIKHLYDNIILLGAIYLDKVDTQDFNIIQL